MQEAFMLLSPLIPLSRLLLLVLVIAERYLISWHVEQLCCIIASWKELIIQKCLGTGSCLQELGRKQNRNWPLQALS